MIRSWKDAATRRFGEQDKGSFAGLDRSRAKSRLQLLDAMQLLDEVPSLASIGLHKLKGGRRNQWATTINGHWRLVFEFRDGDAFDVQITDYH
ncbi:MAG TPA: type II toxin-antitoxin system RelE/ParE family toxin [Rhizomicrobium sp.]|jgi:proteic killer suppression protein|nr:type II toxin-antitoxin system RelE/ParE family toxin [Rhizomicrobium sp.]